MLQEIIQLHDEAVTALVDKVAQKDVVTFKSPTGSGKTYMMADAMNRILGEHNDVVFLVSSLSKSGLAKQNYDKFCEYQAHGEFPHLNPYLISSEVAGEEGVFVPTDYNVYVLPRDLYKKGGRLMQGAMDNFLQTITKNLFGNGLNKQVYLIKDECHQATNNLDTISTDYFTKVINISATPKLSRNQVPDVEVTEEAAINAKLIKTVEWNEDDSDVSDAIKKFEEIKEDYRNKLGVNPCLIIQISNKDKANEDLACIHSVLNQKQYKDLKWMLIVDKEKDCDTNDVFKAKKIPVSKWRDYARNNESTIDIIIFKMVITEGWDIPRACMLYQMRPTQSEQLDEQVVGRVRRNPRLLDYERLSPEAQELALKAWVWGVKKKEQQRTFCAKLFDGPPDITKEIKLRTTHLKTLVHKSGFNINTFMNGCTDDNRYSDIFTLYRKYKKVEPEVQKLATGYADSPCKWIKFVENIDQIRKESTSYICDYAKSMELTKDEVSFPVESTYTDNGNTLRISDWVWKRKSVEDSNFSFDSEAEREWASIMQELAKDDTNEPKPRRVAKRVTLGEAQKFLWGKNFIANSEIKYEYCLDGVRTSYPDFIMEDCFGRIHIFEVKSVNIANSSRAFLDSDAYKRKMNELVRCYTQASILTKHVFYLPVKKDDKWFVTRLLNGEENTLTCDEFFNFVKTAPHPFPKTLTHLPVYSLRAACGCFDDCGRLQAEEAEEWRDVSGCGISLNDKMFIVHAEGDSMLPKIKNGDLCVFDASGVGSREGKIVLVKAKDKNAPDASSFTIKKYHSEKILDENGNLQHSKITLSPLNTAFPPIVIHADEAEEGEFKIYGELVKVLQA